MKKRVLPSLGLRRMLSRFSLIGVIGVAGFNGVAQAEGISSYPSRPIRVVVPYTPGGVSDTVTRLITQRLSERLGQTVIVENRGGANGMIGSDNVAKSPADGYSFVVVVAAHAINPTLYKKMAYDPIKDLTGVSQFGSIPLLLVSSAALPARTLPDLLAWGKQNATGLTYASSGQGSGAHLAGEMLARQTGVTMMHVPYKGISPALPDLFTGQVSLIFDSLQTMMPQVKAGKLHALAISSPQRWPNAPEVPTMNELGYPDMTFSSRIGLLAPAKTPEPIRNKVAAEIDAIVKEPAIHDRLMDYGIAPVGGMPQQFQRFIEEEYQRWAELARQIDIRLD